MLCLVDSAVDLMRTKHKNGEEFYWLLYYAYLSPQEFQNVEEIIDQLRPHIRAQDSAGIVREFLAG